VGGDRRTRRLVQHILEFAADEGMQVVAEGIETEEQRKSVVDLGCPLLQGYLLGKGEPLSVVLQGAEQVAAPPARAAAFVS
jgi:EAL domain-containing protein (putative c-di-GMP-specific phosphodiesterase class I)